MPFQKEDLRDMVLDEQSGVSSARIGMWISFLVIVEMVQIDVVLAMLGRVGLPAAPYAILSTMFLGFVSWAAGPRIAQYVAPQIGQVAAGIAQSVRSWGSKDDVTPEEREARREQNKFDTDD